VQRPSPSARQIYAAVGVEIEKKIGKTVLGESVAYRLRGDIVAGEMADEHLRHATKIPDGQAAVTAGAWQEKAPRQSAASTVIAGDSEAIQTEDPSGIESAGRVPFSPCGEAGPKGRVRRCGASPLGPRVPVACSGRRRLSRLANSAA